VTPALKVLERATSAADDHPADLALYFQRLGETLCALGRRSEGLALLQQQVTAGEQNGDYPNAPWLARLRAVTGICALQANDRTTATKYATLARAAFIAQPGVSPYYKAPLFKLELALGLRLPPV
jgi:hypothetical protein